MKQFVFDCGGTEPGPVDADANRIALDVQGAGGNVNLRISDISRTMVADVPDLLLDLLEVAAYVYCADQRATRGSEKLSKAGKDWSRDMRFVIPVRQPQLWSSAAVRDALQETLGFLSDDVYEFSFVPASAPMAERASYFPDLSDVHFDADEVALFSGGIDSFAGAVDSLARLGKRMVLVGHFSAPKVFSVQKRLIDRLRTAGFQFRYVPVNVTNTGVPSAETTQRSRSFLYASLAFVLARMLGQDGFTLFENGVVSMNLPIARDVLGGRATRTTHPKVIRGFEQFFSALVDRPIEVRTPFIWETKADAVHRIVGNGFAADLASTVSCTHPRSWTKIVHHCGACSQCIDRRFAVLAAGAGQHDPASDYAIDLLTGDRSLDDQVRMAVAYVKLCQTISASSRDQLPTAFPGVVSTLSYLPCESTTEALDRVWDLFSRHAAGVLSVVAEGLRTHGDALARGMIPKNSLLSLSLARSVIESPPQANYHGQVEAFMDRLSEPVCDFAVDQKGRNILFRGDFRLHGKMFDLIVALLEKHRGAKAGMASVEHTSPSDLAAKLNIDEPGLRKLVSRTRQLVKKKLAVDQGIVIGDNGFIENARIVGYRLARELREVSPADLSQPDLLASLNN